MMAGIVDSVVVDSVEVIIETVVVGSVEILVIAHDKRLGRRLGSVV